ncbi:MAG: hypothetical protein LBF25_01510, partial [Puniceicoccales bacterium]|nr:hypothetical protein [Puniceicoccales bacterium]
MDIKQFLADYVSFPSVSCNGTKVAGMEATRKFLLEFLSQLGFQAREVDTGLHNIVLAKNKHEKGQ